MWFVVHSNVHIPKESWPNWTWYAIEFFIVLAVAMLVPREIMTAYGGEFAEDMKNWIYYSMVGAIFIGWYLIIRSLILKKKILENKY